MKNSKTTQELFQELTSILIISLEENEIVCPTCKGLRFTYRKVNEKEGVIESCTDCYNGKLYVCKHCGKANKTNYCNCKEANKERKFEFQKKENKKEQKLFEKAKKIKFKNYDGKFILEDEDFVKDSDDIEEWLYEQIKYENKTDEELPKYLWATNSTPVFDLNLKDIINDECENDNSYEDMYNCLDTEDEDLDKAQEYLDKWYQKQGDSVNVYYKDYDVAVLLDDVIKEIREDVKKEMNFKCLKREV